MDLAERQELAEQLDSALSHLGRYILGSAKDSNGEMEAAELLIERVRDRLDPPAETELDDEPAWGQP